MPILFLWARGFSDIGKRLMGGQNVSCDFGGGGKYHRARPPKPGLVLEWDLPGLCRFPLRKTTGRKQTGGKTYHRWGGGSKTVLAHKQFFGHPCHRSSRPGTLPGRKCLCSLGSAHST